MRVQCRCRQRFELTHGRTGTIREQWTRHGLQLVVQCPGCQRRLVLRQTASAADPRRPTTAGAK